MNKGRSCVDTSRISRLDARHHSEKLRRALTFTDPGDKNSETSMCLGMSWQPCLANANAGQYLQQPRFPSDISPDLPRDERAKQLRKATWLLVPATLCSRSFCGQRVGV